MYYIHHFLGVFVLSANDLQAHYELLKANGALVVIPNHPAYDTENLLRLLAHDNKRGYLPTVPDTYDMVLLEALGKPARTGNTIISHVHRSDVEAALAACRTSRQGEPHAHSSITSHRRSAGVSVADRLHPIFTVHQLGGHGIVFNKALVIPLHLGNHSQSIEYVVCAPLASVGEHQQATDEMYYITQGIGELMTNGELCQVRAGDLVIAPRGTRHSIRNTGTLQGLGFLVVEVQAPAELAHRPLVMAALPNVLQVENGPSTAIVGHAPVSLRTVRIDLSTCFGGPWGMLTLIELPAGCHLSAYALPEHDENLFVVSGHATIQLDALNAPFSTDDNPERGLNVLVPAGLGRQITNKSSKDPLLVLSLQIRHV